MKFFLWRPCFSFQSKAECLCRVSSMTLVLLCYRLTGRRRLCYKLNEEMLATQSGKRCPKRVGSIPKLPTFTAYNHEILWLLLKSRQCIHHSPFSGGWGRAGELNEVSSGHHSLSPLSLPKVTHTSAIPVTELPCRKQRSFPSCRCAQQTPGHAWCSHHVIYSGQLSHSQCY